MSNATKNETVAEKKITETVESKRGRKPITETLPETLANPTEFHAMITEAFGEVFGEEIDERTAAILVHGAAVMGALRASDTWAQWKADAEIRAHRAQKLEAMQALAELKGITIEQLAALLGES